MTKRNRRTWDGHRNVKREGWDSDYQNFTLTYSEALEPTIESLVIKIVVNGFMCGFPVCCIIEYAKRWLRFMKTHNIEDSKSTLFGVTELGQPFALCLSDVHEPSYQWYEESFS